MEKNNKKTQIIIIIVGILIVGLSCFVGFMLGGKYFDLENKTSSNQKGSVKLLADMILKDNKIIDESINYNDTVINRGLYKLNGSYFFRGNVENNYLILGKYSEDTYIYSLKKNMECLRENSNAIYYDYCQGQSKIKIASKDDDIIWRIIRINDDKTIKLILEGATEPTPYDEDSFDEGQALSKDGHYLNSVVKNTIDKWYTNNIENNNLDKYVITSKFCNNLTGLQSETSFYKLDNPTLDCPVEYQLDLKAGIITADEYAMAGKAGNNYNSYLNSENVPAVWWTMTGSNNYYSDSLIYTVDPLDNHISGDYLASLRTTGNPRVARPVITLKSDISVTGNGTKESPYKIK